MTLAEQRAAIAANMAASRAPTSAASRAATQASMAASRAGDGGAARRASGAANAAERRGTSLVENLQTLQAPPTRRATPLPSVPPAGGVPAQTGRGEYKAPAKGGGGLTSPITEVSRTLHPPRLFTSSDGLVVFSLQRTDRLVMRDAEGVLETRYFENA